jgi:hypothetical protein
MTDFSALVSAVTGPVLTAADPGFTEELAGFNLASVHTPDAVVGAANVDDVARAVSFARDNGLSVAPLATGHGSYAPITAGIVVTTRRLTELSIDTAARIATIGAGVRWGAVIAAATDAGLMAIPGSSSNVGVVGYLAGGGLGPLARSHGFSSDHVLGYTVVTGGGDIVEATETENPDLFWALRGGKYGLGIVTEVRLALVELPELFGGNLLFEADDVEPVLRAWVDFTATAPADVTTSIAIMRFPPFDEVPEVMRGKTMLSLRYATPGVDGAALPESLATAARPVVGAVGSLPSAQIATIHNDPTDPAPSWTTGGMLSSVDQDFATTLLGLAGAGASYPFVGVELRHVGGATRTDVAGGSAVGGREADFTYGLIGILGAPGALEAVTGAAAGFRVSLARWIAPTTTINFAGKPTPETVAAAWPAETGERLASVRTKYDPSGVFH